MEAVEAVEKGSYLEVQMGQPTIVESVRPWRSWMDIAEVQAGQRTRWIVYCSKTDAPAKMAINLSVIMKSYIEPNSIHVCISFNIYIYTVRTVAVFYIVGILSH